jgi:hypothetical protein
MLRDAVWLAKKEYQYQWRALIATFIASLFIGTFAGFLLSGSNGSEIQEFSDFIQRYTLDLFFVGIAPSFATFFMAKPYLSFQNAKQNPYGKRMAVLRSLPVPVSVLSLSRIILMLSTLVIMSLAFYGMMGTVLFGISGSGFNLLTVGEFLTFGCFWFGFAMVVGGISPYIEYGMKGIMLHILPYLFMGLFVLVELLLMVNGVGIVETSFEIVKSVGWIAALISMLVGIICSYGWNQLLKYRLENRDYL